MSIHLITGNDQYKINKKIKDLVKESGVDVYNAVTYDIEETPFSVALSDAQTIPFMSDKKIVVVKNIDFKEKEGYSEIDFINYIENSPSFTDMILVPNKKLDSKKKIVKLLNKHGDVYELNKVEENQLEQAAVKYLKRRNIDINRESLKELMIRTEKDTQRMMNELTKIENYLDGGGLVTLEVINDLVSKNVENDVFKLINAIVDRNIEESMSIYYDLLKTEDPIRLIGLIVNKFRELNYAKTLITKGYKKEEIMKFFNASSGRAYYIMKNASNVSLEYIEKQLDHLSKIDIEIKKGLLDKKLGLEMYLLKI